MTSSLRARGELTLKGFGWRLLFCFVLVLLSYNPTGYSLVHWIYNSIKASEFGPWQALCGVIALGGWSVVVVATWRALDRFGTVLVTLALGAIVWVLVDIGLVTAKTFSAVSWIILICLAITLAIGMCWAHIWRKITGQVTVDEVEG
ncbi:DUF6524 family protein [Aurantivibrio plasticivorans]